MTTTLASNAVDGPVTHAPPQQTDGVVCFAAVDWWYHNRGHSECQILSRIARHAPVLWINSIGMRAPSPGKTELVWRRYVRKAKSTLKGLRRDEASGMWVYSPIFVPRYTPGWVEFNGRLLALQVSILLRHLEIHHPAAWATIPTSVPAVERLKWSTVVFNRSDEFAAFPEADASLIAPLEQRMLRRAEHTLYVNRKLFAREKDTVRDGQFLGHGVDFEHFAKVRPASGQRPPKPEAMKNLKGPIIGFYGALDNYTIDLPLLVKVARAHPDATLLIIGPKAMDIAALVAEPNVCYLGPIPYAQLPNYAAHFDVALMPWLKNDWIEACNPIKLKEYLALGFPVVSISFPELVPYADLVYSADSHEGFLQALEQAIKESDRGLVERRRDAVRHDGWDALAASAASLLGVGQGKGRASDRKVR